MLILTNFVGSYCFAKETIKIGFYDLPPYMSAGLEKHGVIGLLLEKALSEKGDIQLLSITSVRLPYLLNKQDIVAGVTTANDLCEKTEEYTCSEVIKLIPVVLAYRAENVEFDTINSVDELVKQSEYIGQPKEYVLFDEKNKRIQFKEIKDAVSGLKLLEVQRLNGFLMSEDGFDYNKVHKIIEQSTKKSKQLLQIPIRIIVKKDAESQWIIQNLNNYMRTNSYDSLWLDYYLNYATAKQ